MDTDDRMLKDSDGRPRKKKAGKASRAPATEPEGIKCPKCGGHEIYVYRTRPKGSNVTRYRGCKTCKHLFTTEEKWKT